MVTKQAAPAYESEAFRWTAAQVVSTHVLAHVRKATVGRPELLNTHPFSYGCWMLVHNGNLGAFQAIRQRIIDFIGPHHAAAIEGTTDSENVFHLLLASMERYPDRPTMEILRTGIQLVRSWSRSADPTAEVALNLMLTNGRELYGSRVDRSLWYVERHEVHPCQVCGGARHVERVPASDYRAVVIASEPITSDEDWKDVPDESLFRLGPDIEISFEPLD